jgi:hypothetical protein
MKHLFIEHELLSFAAKFPVVVMIVEIMWRDENFVAFGLGLLDKGDEIFYRAIFLEHLFCQAVCCALRLHEFVLWVCDHKCCSSIVKHNVPFFTFAVLDKLKVFAILDFLTRFENSSKMNVQVSVS